jgi:hypothetical protein
MTCWHQPDLANASRLEVTIPIENLQNWLLIERRLSSMETVRSIKVKEISSRQALVELSVSKSQEQLISELANQGFYLEERMGQLILVTTNTSQPLF